MITNLEGQQVFPPFRVTVPADPEFPEYDPDTGELLLERTLTLPNNIEELWTDEELLAHGLRRPAGSTASRQGKAK